jgi:hypothetical protein
MSQILKLLRTRAVEDICRVQKGGPILNGYGLDPSILQKGNPTQLCGNRRDSNNNPSRLRRSTVLNIIHTGNLESHFERTQIGEFWSRARSHSNTSTCLSRSIKSRACIGWPYEGKNKTPRECTEYIRQISRTDFFIFFLYFIFF